jgi:hypothetical protein
MNLKQIMNEKEITTYALCKKAGIKTTQHFRIAQILAGNNSVSIDNLKKLCAGVSELSGQNITMEDLDFDLVLVKLK